MLKQALQPDLDLERLIRANEECGPQLPQGNLRMVHRILSLTEHEGRYRRGTLVAEYDINPEQWFFSCHFPGDPIMPGCLALDGLWQCLGLYLAWRGYQGKARAIGVDTVRFLGEILPQTGVVQYRLQVRRIMNRDFTMGIADGEVWVNDEQVYRADNLRVALFKPGAEQRAGQHHEECA